MKYLGIIEDDRDLVTKEYVDTNFVKKGENENEEGNIGYSKIRMIDGEKSELYYLNLPDDLRIDIDGQAPMDYVKAPLYFIDFCFSLFYTWKKTTLPSSMSKDEIEETILKEFNRIFYLERIYYEWDREFIIGSYKDFFKRYFNLLNPLNYPEYIYILRDSFLRFERYSGGSVVGKVLGDMLSRIKKIEENPQLAVGIPAFFSKTYLKDATNLDWISIDKRHFKKFERNSEDKVVINNNEKKVDTFYSTNGLFINDLEEVQGNISDCKGKLLLCVADHDGKYWFITKGTLFVKWNELLGNDWWKEASSTISPFQDLVLVNTSLIPPKKRINTEN